MDPQGVSADARSRRRPDHRLSARARGDGRPGGRATAPRRRPRGDRPSHPAGGGVRPRPRPPADPAGHPGPPPRLRAALGRQEQPRPVLPRDGRWPGLAGDARRPHGSRSPNRTHWSTNGPSASSPPVLRPRADGRPGAGSATCGGSVRSSAGFAISRARPRSRRCSTGSRSSGRRGGSIAAASRDGRELTRAAR